MLIAIQFLEALYILYIIMTELNKYICIIVLLLQ